VLDALARWDLAAIDTPDDPVDERRDPVRFAGGHPDCKAVAVVVLSTIRLDVIPARSPATDLPLLAAPY
jgi:hypothetical protein